MTTKYKKQSIKGFTLLELLVTMVIIGIITGLVVLSVKSVSKIDELKSWMLTFEQNLEYAKDMSVLRRKNYGIVFSAKNLSFMQNDDSEWVLSSDPALGKMQYPKGSFINLYLRQDKLLVDDNKKVNVTINAVSDITPFELHLVRASKRRILQVEPTGEISISQR